MLLSDATARYGELTGGQLGDVLFEDWRTFRATLGSKRDRGGAGKPVAVPTAPEPGSGAASLVDSARCATVLLFATFRKASVLEVLARGFASTGQDCHTPGSAAMAARPVEVRALAPRL